MDPTIISEAKMPTILAALHEGKFDTAKQMLQTCGSFAYTMLRATLEEKLDPKKYSEKEPLTFKRNFVSDIAELLRILYCLEDLDNAKQYEQHISATILECIADGASFIEQSSNDYPKNPINGKIWIDGAGLRDQALELARYFERKGDNQNEVEALFVRVRITLSIMSHYPNSVGPDMIAVGLKLEALGNVEKAKKFYQPVVSDLVRFVLKIDAIFDEPGEEIREEDLLIAQSLVDALNGLKRLGETVDEDLLTKATEVLNNVKLRLGG